MTVHDGLRVAIVGTGFIGAVHARSARVNGARLVAVAASTPERSDAAARRLGADRWTPAAELVVADDVDVVHIAAPNHLHEPLALAALSAGKHVVLEKPVALDARGAATIAEAARAADRFVTVPFAYRFHPVVRHARAMVRGGELGDVRLVHGSYQQDWMSRPTDDNWRADSAVGGASKAFADIGSHWVDLAEFVSGLRIVRVVATMATVIPERVVAGNREAFGGGEDTGDRRTVTTEDVAVVSFEAAGGILGSVVVSQVSPGRKNRLWLEVDGAAAAVAFDQEDSEHLWVGSRDCTRVVARDPATLHPDAARLATLPAGHAQGYHDCFDLFVADTYAAIRTGEIPDGLPTIADGVAAARVTDAVIASAAARSWVDV